MIGLTTLVTFFLWTKKFAPVTMGYMREELNEKKEKESYEIEQVMLLDQVLQFSNTKLS